MFGPILPRAARQTAFDLAQQVHLRCSSEFPVLDVQLGGAQNYMLVTSHDGRTRTRDSASVSHLEAKVAASDQPEERRR